jgi:hypothetical protein
VDEDHGVGGGRRRGHGGLLAGGLLAGGLQLRDPETSRTGGTAVRAEAVACSYQRRFSPVPSSATPGGKTTGVADAAARHTPRAPRRRAEEIRAAMAEVSLPCRVKHRTPTTRVRARLHLLPPGLDNKSGVSGRRAPSQRLRDQPEKDSRAAVLTTGQPRATGSSASSSSASATVWATALDGEGSTAAGPSDPKASDLDAAQPCAPSVRSTSIRKPVRSVVLT